MIVMLNIEEIRMMIRNPQLLVVVAILCSVSTAMAQNQKPDSSAEPPPGGIRLLPGYQHERLQGIDSLPGRIWKKDGMTINYDIGKLAGNYVEAARKDKNKQEQWYKEQTVDKQPVQLLLTRNRELYVTFPKAMPGQSGGPANFYAEVKTDEDLADALLMLLTFRSDRSVK